MFIRNTKFFTLHYNHHNFNQDKDTKKNPDFSSREREDGINFGLQNIDDTCWDLLQGIYISYVYLYCRYLKCVDDLDC